MSSTIIPATTTTSSTTIATAPLVVAVSATTNAATKSSNNIKTVTSKLKTSLSSSAISLKSERPSSLNLDITHATTLTHSISNLHNMTTKSNDNKESPRDHLAGSAGCDSVVGVVDDGASDAGFNSFSINKNITSDNITASSSPSSPFLPDMPQWKRDLIQRRKQNVARTLNAATTSRKLYCNSINNSTEGDGNASGIFSGNRGDFSAYTLANSSTISTTCSSFSGSPFVSPSASSSASSSIAGAINMNIEQHAASSATATTVAAVIDGIQSNTIKDVNNKSLSTSPSLSSLVTHPRNSIRLNDMQKLMEPAIIQQELPIITATLITTTITRTTTTNNTLMKKEKSVKLLLAGQYSTTQQLQLQQESHEQQQQEHSIVTKTKSTTAKDTVHNRDQQLQQHHHHHTHHHYYSNHHEFSMKKMERQTVMEEEQRQQLEQHQDQNTNRKLQIFYKTKEQQQKQQQEEQESKQDIYDDDVFYEPAKVQLKDKVKEVAKEKQKEQEEEVKEQQIVNYSQKYLVKPITQTTTATTTETTETKTHLTGSTQQLPQQQNQQQQQQKVITYTTTTNVFSKQTVKTNTNTMSPERFNVRAIDASCGEQRKIYIVERNSSNSTAKQMNGCTNNSNSSNNSNNNNDNNDNNNKSNSRVSTSQSLIKCESDCIAVGGSGKKISEKLQENQFIKNNHKKCQQQQLTQKHFNAYDADVNNITKQQQKEHHHQQQQNNNLYIKNSQKKFLDKSKKNGISGITTISSSINKAITAASASSAAVTAFSSACYLPSCTCVAGVGSGSVAFGGAIGSTGSVIKNETGCLGNTTTTIIGAGAIAAASSSSLTNNCAFVCNTQKKKMVAIQEMKNTTQNTCNVVVNGVGGSVGGVNGGTNNNSNANINGRLTMKTRATTFGTGTIETGNNTNLQINTIDEDFSYGPGIVSKLTCRYLSLALRESMEKERFNKDKLRRSTSLSTLLDKPDHDVDDEVDDDGDDEMETHKCMCNVEDDEQHDDNGGCGNLIRKNHYKSNNTTNDQTANNQIIKTMDDLKAVNKLSFVSSKQNQTNLIENIYLKGCQSQQQQRKTFNQLKTLTTATAATTNNLSRSRQFKRGNDSLKRARSVEALLCEKPSWQQRCMSTITNSNYHVTIENKIHNARERLHQGTDYMPPKRLQSIIDDTERPPPDVVKQTLRLFEATANRRPRLTMNGDRKGDVASKVETFKNIIKEQRIGNFPKSAVGGGAGAGGIVSPVKTGAANFTTSIIKKTFTDLQHQQQQQKLSPPSALSKGSSTNQVPVATAAATSTPPHSTLNSHNINKNINSDLLSDESSDLISRINSTQRTLVKMVEVDSPVTALTKQMKKLHLNDNTNKQTIAATQRQQQQQRQLQKVGQENSVNGDLNSESGGNGGSGDAYHPSTTADMNNKEFINNIITETTLTAPTTTVAVGVPYNIEKCEMNNENNKEDQQQQLQPLQRQQQQQRQLADRVDCVENSDNTNSVGVDVDIDIDVGVDFTTNKTLVNSNSSLAVAGEGIKVHNKRSISSSTINNAKLINSIKIATTRITTTPERRYDNTIVEGNQKLNVNDNKTIATNNNKSNNNSEQEDRELEENIVIHETEEIDEGNAEEETERDIEEKVEYGEFRRITRAALDNIAKAGTSRQYKFSTNTATITTTTTTTTATGKQVGVIRPLLNTHYQHTITTLPADTTSTTVTSTSTISSSSSSLLSDLKKSNTISSNHNKISEGVATTISIATIASGDTMMDTLKHSPLKLTSKAIAPTTGPAPQSVSPLTTREIEKNRINELKKTTSPLAASYTATASSANISSSLSTVINTQMLKSTAGPTILSKSDTSTAVSSGDSDLETVISATNSPLWAMRKRRQTPPVPPADNTTMVFNFSNRKEVPDYIENDGVIFRRRREIPKPTESGFVLLGDLNVETSNDMDYDDFSMCPPSPCDVEFVNANIVIDGKSSIKQKSKEATLLHVQFNDSLTSTFEYPSEASLILDTDADEYDSSFIGADEPYHAISNGGYIDDDNGFNTTFQKLNLKQQHQPITIMKTIVQGEGDNDSVQSMQVQKQKQQQHLLHHHHVDVDEIIELPTTKVTTSATAPSLLQLQSSATTITPASILNASNSSTAANNEIMNKANNLSTTGTKNILGNLPLGSAPLGLYTPVKAPLEKYFQLGITRASTSSSSASSSTSSSLSSSSINQSINNKILANDNQNPIHSQHNLLINGINANISSINKIDGNGSIVGITDGLAVNHDYDVVAKVTAITEGSQQQSPDNSLPYIKPGDDDLNIAYSEGTQKTDLLY